MSCDKGNVESDLFESEFYDYIFNLRKNDLLEILKQPNDGGHFPLNIHFLECKEECPTSVVKLLQDPDRVLDIADRAARRVLFDLYDQEDSKYALVPNKYVHVRFHSMPAIWDKFKTQFPGCKERGHFLTLVGTVVRTTSPKLLEYKKTYRCSKCKQTMNYEAPASRGHHFPKTLDNCENACIGGKVELVDQGEETSNSFFRDYQEVKVQEHITGSGFGIMPKAMWVVLENDLVDSCKPGDDVIINGTLFIRITRPLRANQRIYAETVFRANHVQVKNDQRAAILINDEMVKSFEDFWQKHEENPFEGRDVILRSFCPQIYGMYVVKLALCMVLAGGVPRTESGSHVRGESHILLVGDPGTGKSQLLKYVSKIVPRAVFTNGIGTTSAGLTVSAVKDCGEWNLEAGALVLADCGVCCIDEFSNIKEHDKISIHEAMEQQTISVAKAGMVCKLSTKCTVVAATNPKFGKYDENQAIEMNIGLATPLLSRFDLVIALKDAENDAWDDFLCDFILGDVREFEQATENAHKTGFLWDTERLQSYLMLIKEKTPEIGEDAQTVLSTYYLSQRKNEKRSEARTTVRLLESLYRLAEGHAKLMYRDYVSVHDAVTAVSLMEASMQSFSLSHVTNTLHIAFPKDPLQEYYNQAQIILQLLQLDTLWATEKIYLENMMRRRSIKKHPSDPQPPPSSTRSVIIRQTQPKSLMAGNRILSQLQSQAAALSQSVGPQNYDGTTELFESSESEDDSIECGYFGAKVLATSTQINPSNSKSPTCIVPETPEDVDGEAETEVLSQSHINSQLSGFGSSRNLKEEIRSGRKRSSLDESNYFTGVGADVTKQIKIQDEPSAVSSSPEKKNSPSSSQHRSSKFKNLLSRFRRIEKE